jgi:hypothetical protein
LELLKQIECHFQQTKNNDDDEPRSNDDDDTTNRPKTTMIERVPADPEALAEMIEI